MAVQSEVTSLGELLWARADLDPDRIAFRELRNDLSERDCVTYAELHRRACRLGESLARLAQPGDRALLITPNSIDYLTALFACFYAGVVAVSGVPAYAPSARSLRHTARLRRLHSILEDSGARVMIGPQDLLSRIDQGLSANDGPRPVSLAMDGIATSTAPVSWRPLTSERNAMAILQYTSGSTTSPGGVVLRHANLLHNLAAQEAAFEVSANDVGVSWLPLHHDLGLIGACLLPIYSGFPSVLLPAAGFLEQPRRWLECLSTFAGTISWAPNFAYKLCLKSIAPDERDSLDLTPWRIAMNAAEPVQATTIREFAKGFEGAGFNPRAMYPSYGLAEATLAVSAPTPGSLPHIVRLDKSALAAGEVVVLGPGDRGRAATELVGCGHPAPGVEVTIVDPLTLARQPSWRVGEIWVSGPGKSEGYFKGPGVERAPFEAALAGAPSPYLRTGDLGFMLGGDLFITGRLKDLIILRGANIYPQDLEMTAALSHPALREDCACAFSGIADGEEVLVIVCEIDRRRTAEATEAISAIRRAIFEDHGLETYAVALIPFGAIPKTPSGKIQRSLCAEAWRNGTLSVVWESHGAPPSDRPAPPVAASGLVPLTGSPVLAWIVERLSQFTPDVDIDARSDLANLGLSSVQITELAGNLQTEFGRHILAADLYECRRIADIVALLGHPERDEVDPTFAASTKTRS